MANLNRSRHQHGQSLVEFTLLLPVLLIVLFGLLDLGRSVYTYAVLSHAAHEGARAAIVVDNTTAEIIAAALATAVGIGLQPTEVQVIGSREPGTEVTVVVQRTFTLVTPIISQITGQTLALSASATMIVD